MEEPDHIDWVALRGAVRVARQNGRACLVEGHTLLSDAGLVDEASSILFLDACPSVCTARRIGRRERSEQERAEIAACNL
jgi:uridine kinase